MDEVWKKLASRGYYRDYVPVLPCDNLDPHLKAVLSDTMRICFLFNSNPGQPILDLAGLEEVFVATCYRLLRFIPVRASTVQTSLETACHLGLLMFIMTAFFQIGQARIIDFEVLSLRFNDILTSDLCAPNHDISIWLMTIGSIWHSKGVQNDLITTKIRQQAQQRGIRSWGDFRGCLQKFPWIQALHDRPAYQIWTQVQQNHQALGLKGYHFVSISSDLDSANEMLTT